MGVSELLWGIALNNLVDRPGDSISYQSNWMYWIHVYIVWFSNERHIANDTTGGIIT
jgi:hypothetical protein